MSNVPWIRSAIDSNLFRRKSIFRWRSIILWGFDSLSFLRESIGFSCIVLSWLSEIFVGFKWVLINPLATDPPTTKQPTTDHLRTNQPTHQPTYSKFTDPLTRFYFEDLIIKKYLFCRIQTQLGKCKTIILSIWAFVFMTNIKDMLKN